MNYVLQIDLVGADKADSALSALMDKVKSIGKGKMPSFDEWLDTGSMAPKAEKSGEKVGKKFSDGFKKYGMADLRKLFSKDGWALPKIENPITGKEIQKIDWKKILTGIGLGYSNPYIGSRLLSDELGKGKSAGIAGGLFGNGGIAGFSELFLAFKAFKFAVEVFSKATEQARMFYSKALESGLGLKTQITRTVLANLLGVSEKDIYRFGDQIAYLNGKIKTATDALTRTNPAITTIGIEFGILKLDLDALIATIAEKLAPAMTMLIKIFDSLTNVLTKFFSQHKWAKYLLMGAGTFTLDYLQGKSKEGATTIPSPQSFMRQIPASTWQHMGLALQGGGNTTNELIRKSNFYLKGIHDTIKNGGVARAFGMSPVTANP